MFLSSVSLCLPGCKKVTVIVILNKKCSLTNDELVKAVVLFRAFNIPPVVFTTMKSTAKNSSLKQFVLFR